MKNIKTYDQLFENRYQFFKDKKRNNVAIIENELIDLFYQFNTDKKWIVDRFNDKETKDFIAYLNKTLNR